MSTLSLIGSVDMKLEMNPLKLVDTGKKLNDEQITEVVDFDVNISTVSRYIDGRLINIKKMHPVSETCNSLENKRKQIAYVERLKDYVSRVLRIVWIDKTNFNLHCSRTRGRAS